MAFTSKRVDRLAGIKPKDRRFTMGTVLGVGPREK